MNKEDQSRFPPLPVRLADNRKGVIRVLSLNDAGLLGDFYESVPPEDFRFYCPHELTRERAAANSANASSHNEVVLVLETTEGVIGGYAWFRWEREVDRSGFGICLRRELQGLGAGRALMTRIMEIAHDIGPPTMGLTVQTANTAAVRLYEDMGFRVVSKTMRPPREEWGLPAEPQYRMERRVR